ncbi:MAG: glycerol kinase GlpK [Actinobacteria bacterium]|nr:glycerol kinase GlpK [Actinomycetota bacterium]
MILSLDQGTTGSTALLIDDEGRVSARRSREFTQHFPRPGWVEHDAAEIWEVTAAVAHEALEAAGARGPDLRGVGITNQRETVVVWDRATGEPLAPAIVWQDRRTTARCEQLAAEGLQQLVRARTGLTLDPYFSATKIEWLLENVPGLRERPPREICFGTIDSWLAFKLTGRHVTDYTNASRTMLFDIARLDWDEELCARFGVDRASLPEVLPSQGVFGQTDPSIFGGASVPLAGIAGDQQAALFGQACTRPGLAKNTYGTGSFVLLNVGSKPPPPTEGLLTTVAWGDGEAVSYALEASVFVAGAAVQWLRDGLGIIGAAGESERLAASLKSNDGVYFVPALTGLGSPHWDPHAHGAIMGLTRGTTRAHLARAALEAIAYQTADAVTAMRGAGGPDLTELHADGGAVANTWLMQFQADVLGVPVVVPEVTETTAYGAGLLAGVATGAWSADEVSRLWREDVRYEPGMPESRRAALLDEWAATVHAARGRGTPTGGEGESE